MDDEFTNVINRTIRATAMECIMAPMDNNHMTCTFTNGNGVSTKINNVAFYHVDGVNPKMDVHRDKSTGNTIIAVQSDGMMACDMMGEPTRGVTVRCRE
jgi:hypothetical protein